MKEAVEILRAQLNSLPETHPDRLGLEAMVTLGEGWHYKNGRVEQPRLEMVRFSDEAKAALLKQKFVIHELTGQSIKSLRDSDRKFWTDWHKQYPDFESLTSIHSEVAINPDKLF